ncbi:MAG: DUF3097 domain-containing protein [Propionibacteriaceae bacterium]|jgi:hypothetical protein|nr:DUF3097 domain-containing protein [Propionibacteriaceae bacterium]
MVIDRYPTDVLAPGWQKAAKPQAKTVTLALDLVVEDATSGWCGAVTTWENGWVVLEDRHGNKKSFPIGPGFLLEGKPVTLVAPVRRAAPAPGHTASGSLAGPTGPAQVAHASRLVVEGLHDAELIERVWGDDLRHIGVVTEPLGGLDHLADYVANFQPGPSRRLGVLADHLTPGTKETKIADAVRSGPYGAHVLILGHRYVDIWQAVNPAALGLAAWPDVPKGQDWKTGVCERLGWAYRTQADLAQAWRRIRSAVKTWEDLDRAFVTNVERLIDFIQEGDG